MSSAPWFLVSVAGLGIAICALGSTGLTAPQSTASASDVPAKFVGAAACAGCHKTQHDEWTGGRHSKMIQPATAAAVKGDFSKRTVTLHGRRFDLVAKNDGYYITESYLTGRPQEHRVEYTLGSRRIQHYLTTIDKGWVIVLPPSWDVQRREWFDNMDIVRPDEDDKTLVQQWNRNCFGCHVSRQDNHYDPATRTYATRWMDTGTSCERCHGPGGRHVERYSHPESNAGDRARSIVRPTSLAPDASSQICAQCHSYRDVIAPEFTAGDDYYDYFMPILEYGPRKDADPTYWADGRPRRFSNDAIGMWQSQCYLRGGMTCTTCHADPHEPDVDRHAELAPTNNALCTRCHQEIGKQPTAHTRHAASSAGSSCVACHMPRAVQSIKATIRDHTISVPTPENTVAFGIPNACSECHTDKSAAWAVAAAKKGWPGNRRASMVARAAAFSAARAGKPGAIDGLLAIAADERETPVVRATALGHMKDVREPRVVPALVAALNAPHPAMRAVAAANLGEVRGSAGVTSALARALDDPKRAVRMSAFVALMNGPALGGEDERKFRRVSREFMARADLRPDDAPIQQDLGVVAIRTGEYDLAAATLENSLALGSQASRYLLAIARIGQRRFAAARALLQQVPASDPNHAAAQERLKELAAKR
jgi:predicted CXXCH cytochrome family protein